MKVSLIQINSQDQKEENIQKAFHWMDESVNHGVESFVYLKSFYIGEKVEGLKSKNLIQLKCFKSMRKRIK